MTTRPSEQARDAVSERMLKTMSDLVAEIGGLNEKELRMLEGGLQETIIYHSNEAGVPPHMVALSDLVEDAVERRFGQGGRH